MSNIGHVQYTKSDVLGELKAVWVHDDYGMGTGLATGNDNSKFEGSYQIQYFDEAKVLVAELELEITHLGDTYKVTWSNNGVVSSIGIGMERDNVLSVGYYDVK